MTLALVKAAKVHARLAPSKAHRWLVCPGSMHVTTEDPETEWAAEGTRKHAVLELILSAKEDECAFCHCTPTTRTDCTMCVGPLIAGDTIQTECGPYVVPLEVLEQCYEIKEYIEQYQQTHVDGWVFETETKVEIGTHLWPGMVKGDCAGTTDCAGYSYEELLVLDAKFGFVQVEARGNPQLMLYALGLLAEIPFPIQHVTLCIAQPGYDGLVLFREHRLTVEELHAWAFDQQHVVEEIQAGSRRLHADNKACQYCPARTQCPERLRALDDAMSESWMVSRTLEELLPYVPRLKAIAKDIEQRALAELTQGKPVRGWKAVAAKSRRKWSAEDETQVAVGIAVDLGTDSTFNQDVFYDKTLKSPAQMEKVVRATKKMPVREAKAIVDKYAYSPTGAPKLVPESDPRPALEAATWTLEDVLNASLEANNETD